MPLVLEAVDLAALCAEALAWALLTVLVILLAKLVSQMHFHLDLGIVSFEPLGWLADALSSYVLAGAEDARQAVEGAMKATLDGLTWSFDELLGVFTDLAHATKALALYLWQHVVKPWTLGLLTPIRAAVAKVDAELAALTKTVAQNLTKAERYADGQATKAIGSAEAFTKTEIRAARQAAEAEAAAITARLDGIATQATAVAEDVLRAPGQVWGDIGKYVDPKNLAEATILGVLGALGIHTLTSATGLDSQTCQGRHKDLCGIDPSQWAQWLAQIALMAGVLDFAELLALCRVVFHEGESLVLDAV